MDTFVWNGLYDEAYIFEHELNDDTHVTIKSVTQGKQNLMTIPLDALVDFVATCVSENHDELVTRLKQLVH